MLEWNVEIIGLYAIGAFGFLWLVRMLYVFCLYLRPLLRISKKEKSAFLPTDTPPVSVVVIALNKGAEFIRNIEKILAQQYPCFEVIVVIDNADKDVEDELKLLMHTDSRVRYTFVPHETKSVSRRKLALIIALKAARYDWILQTEYSCYPSSDKWMARMVNARTESTEIVLGGTVSESLPAGIRRTMNYFDLLKSLEMLSCGIYNLPYVGNSANLLLQKELLFKHISFGKSLKEELGEDLVLVNTAATDKNLAVELNSESLTVNSLLDKEDWTVRYTSAKRCRKLLGGFGKTLWKMSSVFSFLYFVALVFAVVMQLHSVLFLSVIGGMHILYRCSFWTILLCYSNKTRSVRFYTLPFYSRLLLPFVGSRKRSIIRRRK